jgi:hypothetical protein
MALVREARRPKTLQEAQVHPTEYGYWITPEGETIPVPYQQHNEVAGMLLGCSMPKMVALTKGWIRVTCPPKTALGNGIGGRRFYVEIDKGKPSIRAVATLQRLALSEDWTTYRLDVNDEQGLLDLAHTNSFQMVSEFMAAIRNARKPKEDQI